MPELPEVETVCRTLAPQLVGRQFVAFELLWPRTFSADPALFHSCVLGKRIETVSRRAKLIQITLDDSSMMTVHLRMTGELLWTPAGSEPDADKQKFLRAEFLLDDGSALLFYDVRKFGRIDCYVPEVAGDLDSRFGIEPLSEAFTAEWLAESLSARKRQIKPLLLDQTFIAGLGNIYVDEALFLAGIHPQSQSHSIDSGRMHALRDAIVNVLTGALERRGTTLRDYRSGMGEPGQNRPRLQVYGSRPGTPCPRCATPLQRLVVGQRGSIFCPACQPLAATADMQSR